MTYEENILEPIFRQMDDPNARYYTGTLPCQHCGKQTMIRIRAPDAMGVMYSDTPPQAPTIDWNKRKYVLQDGEVIFLRLQSLGQRVRER